MEGEFGLFSLGQRQTEESLSELSPNLQLHNKKIPGRCPSVNYASNPSIILLFFFFFPFF